MVTYLSTTASRTIQVLTAEVGTILTIFAPTSVVQGQPFLINGELRRADTNQVLAGETITAYHNGVLIGSDVTAISGEYNIDAVINEVGTYTLTVNFAGSTRPGLALGPSSAFTRVGLVESSLLPLLLAGVFAYFVLKK